MSRKRLRILTWHVHGNYLYYLSHAPHDFYVVTKPGNPPGYAGCGGSLPWGANIHELPYAQVSRTKLDCILYQHQRHYLEDREFVLSSAQRALPAIFLEHDPPQQHPTNTLHPVQNPAILLVHVTPFNALMWDNGVTPHCVIEHGVVEPAKVPQQGTLARGICAVNHLARRGRRLGADIFETVRRQVPLDLVGMGAQEMDGLGEIPNPELPAFMARYRFFFNPIRYTSLGLAVIEAMMVGLPVVALATTEVALLIASGRNGYADTRIPLLVEAMRRLLDDPGLAREWGEQARRDALARFSIGRFAHDWDRVLRLVAV
ncbi:MAG TPA: glycosyltransferase family 4 protein [Burkholderiaceae bacterium]|nr:glycosyltransferase family 4 protein [Burkholderiaceae bacterium]